MNTVESESANTGRFEYVANFQKGIMETEKKNATKPVAIHRVYTEAGGSKVHGNFGLSTPAALEIQDSQLVSPCGKHRAVFTPVAKLAQKHTQIRITHGPERGLVGDLDATCRKVADDPKKSGWTFWRVVTPPAWYAAKLAALSAKVESEMALDSQLAKPPTAKAKKTAAAAAAAKGQGTMAAAMGGLES